MSYENPPVPEAGDAGRDGVLTEFLRLLIALAAIVIVVGGLLFFAGGWLAQLVPYATEAAWTGDRVLGIAIGTPPAAATEQYLQTLADRLAAAMELPPGMTPRVHYAGLDMPNAFATLGGHIVVTAALYRQMPSENSLAFVLAHEIAHIEARDPIAAVGGGALLSIGLVLLGGNSESLAPYVAQGVQRGYSRRAERRADAAALEAIRRVYGHTGGAGAVFEVLAAEQPKVSQGVPSLLQTHPPTAERSAALEAAAAGWDPTTQPLRPLVVDAD